MGDWHRKIFKMCKFFTFVEKIVEISKPKVIFTVLCHLPGRLGDFNIELGGF